VGRFALRFVAEIRPLDPLVRPLRFFEIVVPRFFGGVAQSIFVTVEMPSTRCVAQLLSFIAPAGRLTTHLEIAAVFSHKTP